MTQASTIMLVDDHAIVREGYRSLLQKQPRLKVVAEAGDGAEAYRLFKETRPDLVIMDLTMPGLGGIEAIRRIRQWDPAARILVFTMHQNAAYAVQAIRAGARGYVTKSSPPEALVRAAFEVLRGGIAFSADIDHELALSRVADTPAATDVLTPREFEILRMLLAERSTEDIAETFFTSVRRRWPIPATSSSPSLASPPTSNWFWSLSAREFWVRRGRTEDASGRWTDRCPLGRRLLSPHPGHDLASRSPHCGGNRPWMNRVSTSSQMGLAEPCLRVAVVLRGADSGRADGGHAALDGRTSGRRAAAPGTPEYDAWMAARAEEAARPKTNQKTDQAQAAGSTQMTRPLASSVSGRRMAIARMVVSS